MDQWLIATVKSPDVIAAVITAIAGLVIYLFPPTARIIWGTTHGFVFTNSQGPNPLLIYTRTVIVQNKGRLEAIDVEIHFNYKPQHFQLWPTFQYEEITTPDNHFIVRVKSLGTREYLNIELLSVGIQLPDTLRVRSAKGVANQVAIRMFRVFPKFVYALIWTLIALGTFTVVQFIARHML